jgi:hypothetical protein
LPTVVVWLAVLAGAKPAAADTTIEDFETNTSFARWIFSNGSEFPGATGILTRDAGRSGSGAHLAYDLGRGGAYVSATLEFERPLRAGALGFWVKEPPRSQAKLRLYDSSGQTLEYAVERPLEAFDASKWFRVVIDTGRPSGHYGGANDGVVHQPLTGMSILAIPENEGAGALTGAVDVDDISTIDSFRASLDPARLPLIAAPPNASELSKNFAVNIHFTSDDRALDAARAAGFGAVRMDLGWSDIETTRGVYDLARFDALVASLAARGMRLHLILDYQNQLYPTMDAGDFMTVTVPAFANMARAVARHFAGKGVTYEVWNEPNGSFWSRTPSDFAAFCNATVAAVHEGDAKARVSTGGVSAFDYRFLSTFFAAHGGRGVDAIGVHPYRQLGGETLAHDWVRVTALLAEAFPGAAPAVWDTEWGYSSSWYGDGHSYDARVQQAQMVARELLSAGSLGFPLIVYYDLRDGGVDARNAEHNFGLLQHDYAEKPAMQAVRTLNEIARNHTFRGFLQTGQSSLHALLFESTAERVVAAWWDNPHNSGVIELPPRTAGRDVLGAHLNLASDGATELTLHERYGPVYLTFASSTETSSSAAGGSAGATSDAAMGGSTAQVSDALTSGAPGAAGAAEPTTAGTSSASSGGSISVRGQDESPRSTGIPTNGATSAQSSGGAPSAAGADSDLDTAAPSRAVACGCTVIGERPPRPLAALIASAGIVAGVARRRRGSRRSHSDSLANAKR